MSEWANLMSLSLYRRQGHGPPYVIRTPAIQRIFCSFVVPLEAESPCYTMRKEGFLCFGVILAASSPLVHAWFLQKPGFQNQIKGSLQEKPKARELEHTFPWSESSPQWIQETFKACQSMVATASLVGVLMAAPTCTSSGSISFQPPDAFAESLLESGVERNQGNAFEEAWTLIDKYYIDRTFGGKDWDFVHTKYRRLFEKAGDDEGKSFKLLSEMVGLLDDKYSRVLDSKMYAAIQKYDLIGVGVTLVPNENKEVIVGSPPIPGSASAEAGLKVGDVVTAVNGKSTEGRNALDIVDQISENPGAKTIKMTVKRGDNLEEYTLSRQTIEVKDPIKYKISERRSDGTVVGYIRISEFNTLVKARMQDALADLEGQGANAYVIDLRMNGGGAFQSAVEMSSLFYSDRVATNVVDAAGSLLPFRTSKNMVIIDDTDPVAIWVDGSSASATEVFAGSLHDNCRAVIMGDKSFGKGLIQAVYGLKDGTGLVVTVAKYVTPNGNEIQGVGITPDFKGGVPLPIPGIASDTSGVDFKEVSHLLDASMCSLPKDIK